MLPSPIPSARNEAAARITGVAFAAARVVVRPGQQRSVKQSLLDAATPVPVLQEIKEYFQRIARTSRLEAERHVTTALYFAAIASALVFHGRRLTSYSAEDLKEAIGKLTG